MCNQGVIAETNASTLTELLEHDKDHSVRAKLREYPDDCEITSKVEALIANAKEVHNHSHVRNVNFVLLLFLLFLFHMVKAEERSLQLKYDKVETEIEILEYDMKLLAHGQNMMLDYFPTSSETLCPLNLSSLYTYLSDEVVLRRKSKYY